MKDPAWLAAFTADELLAELKRRNHGIDLAKVEAYEAEMTKMTLGELGTMRRQANAIWAYRIATAWKGMTETETDLIKQRDYMGCIKSVRERLGLALPEAKELVDTAIKEAKANGSR